MNTTPICSYQPSSKHLSYCMHYPNRPTSSQAEQASNTFRFWKTQWSNTINEAAHDLKFNSKDFFKLDKIGCLYFDDSIIGVIGFSESKLNVFRTEELSLRHRLPENAVDKIKCFHKESVMMISDIILAPEWRGQHFFPKVSHLLMGLGLEEFRHSPSKMLVVFTRNSHKVNDYFYEHGGQPLIKEHSFNGEASDIIGIQKHSLKSYVSSDITGVSHLVWNQYRSKHSQGNSQYFVKF